jgi:hypothetical protein
MRREEDKRTRAKAKQDKRLARRDESAEVSPATSSEDQASVLSQLATLHQELADGQISFELFEAKQEELRSRLQVD